MNIQLDKERPLQMDFQTYMDFEDMTGVKIWDIPNVIQSAKCQIALTLCALKRADPSCSLDKELIIPFFNLKVWAKVQELWLSSMEDKGAKKK